MAMPTKVFISFRRTESAPSAGRIYEGLVARFGRENVLTDGDAPLAGTDSGASIQETLRQCVVLLVIIGPDWLDTEATEGEQGGQGAWRLGDPTDGVRIELETAFALGLRVIPLLVEGARMPTAAELPDGLQHLAQISALIR